MRQRAVPNVVPGDTEVPDDEREDAEDVVGKHADARHKQRAAVRGARGVLHVDQRLEGHHGAAVVHDDEHEQHGEEDDEARDQVADENEVHAVVAEVVERRQDLSDSVGVPHGVDVVGALVDEGNQLGLVERRRLLGAVVPREHRLVVDHEGVALGHEQVVPVQRLRALRHQRVEHLLEHDAGRLARRGDAEQRRHRRRQVEVLVTAVPRPEVGGEGARGLLHVREVEVLGVHDDRGVAQHRRHAAVATALHLPVVRRDDQNRGERVVVDGGDDLLQGIGLVGDGLAVRVALVPLCVDAVLVALLVDVAEVREEETVRRRVLVGDARGQQRRLEPLVVGGVRREPVVLGPARGLVRGVDGAVADQWGDGGEHELAPPRRARHAAADVVLHCLREHVVELRLAVHEVAGDAVVLRRRARQDRHPVRHAEAGELRPRAEFHGVLLEVLRREEVAHGAHARPRHVVAQRVHHDDVHLVRHVADVREVLLDAVGVVVLVEQLRREDGVLEGEDLGELVPDADDQENTKNSVEETHLALPFDVGTVQRFANKVGPVPLVEH
eukprot:PhM_4_TR8762/c0_g2_i3/m.37040